MKCDNILQEAKSLVNILQKIKSRNEKLRDAIVTNIHVLPKFTAAGFFRIEKSTIFRMSTTLITFILVIIQFKFLIKEMQVFEKPSSKKDK